MVNTFPSKNLKDAHQESKQHAKYRDENISFSWQKRNHIWD